MSSSGIPRAARCVRTLAFVVICAGLVAVTPASASTQSSITAAAAAQTASASSASASHSYGSRTLRLGTRGTDVSVLQAYLTLAGFSTRKTGYFGRATWNSVWSYKRAMGFYPVNGTAGMALLRSVRARVRAFAANPPLYTTRINANGTATPPAGSPFVVQQVVAAANQIIHKPYVYGGGHASFYAYGYDCSGSVSYALHGGGLLRYPEAGTALESFGRPGRGRYITVYANWSHAFMVVSGRAFDTANFGGPNIPAGGGPRWRYSPTANLYDGTGGYVARHPAGL